MLSIPHPLGLLRLSLSNRVSSGLSLFCVFTGILWVQSFSLLVGFDFCCVGRIKTPLFFIECMLPSSSWSSGSLSLLLNFYYIVGEFEKKNTDFYSDCSIESVALLAAKCASFCQFCWTRRLAVLFTVLGFYSDVSFHVLNFVLLICYKVRWEMEIIMRRL